MTTASNADKADAAPKPENVKLADFLCFAVYSANLTFGKAYQPLLDALGLTYTQYITIVALYEEGNQTVGGLGQKLFLESNTLTPILKKLENMGHVRRERDSADERQVLVNLTEGGRALRERAYSADLSEACGLSLQEFEDVRDAVLKLRNNLAKSLR
jgi:MarR family transcriptional regulator, organic hydroperoxide resistance regulator